MGTARIASEAKPTGPLEPLGFYVALARRGFARGFTVGVLVSVAQFATAPGWTRALLEAQRQGES